MIQGTKRCTKCGEDKPITEFYKTALTKSGLYSWCKSCHIKAKNEWQKFKRKNDPEFRKKESERHRAYYHKRMETDPAFREKVREYVRRSQQKKSKPIRYCLVCGKILEPLQKRYCYDCSPALSCCGFLKAHHDLLKDDPEHLTTDFLKSILKCKCEVSIE